MRVTYLNKLIVSNIIMMIMTVIYIAKLVRSIEKLTIIALVANFVAIGAENTTL